MNLTFKSLLKFLTQQKIYLERSKNFIYGVIDPVDSKSEVLFSIALTVLEIWRSPLFYDILLFLSANGSNNYFRL